MTSYTVRKGSPDRTRTDLVVIGVGTGKGGRLVVAPGAEPVAAAYGRKFTPLLASMGFGGKFGEAVKVPTNGTINPGQLLVVGLGPLDATTPETVRRAAGVAARSIGNAASVAVALPTPMPRTYAPSPRASGRACTGSRGTSPAPTRRRRAPSRTWSCCPTSRARPR